MPLSYLPTDYYQSTAANIPRKFWDAEGRHHVNQGLIHRVNGLHAPDLLATTGIINLEDCPDHFPTDRRSFIQATADRDPEQKGKTYVLGVPGFAGTDVQMLGGNMMGIMASSALKSGHAPSFIGVNDSGKGTPEYIDEQHRLAKVTRKDQIADAERTAAALIANGVIEDDPRNRVVIVGHSLGRQKGFGVLEAILKNTGLRIHAIVDLMGAGDFTWGLARHPQFLNTVLPHSPRAVYQAWLTKTGAMDIARDGRDYAAALFGIDVTTDLTEEHRALAVPDSARAFLDVTFQKDTAHLPRLMDQFRDRLHRTRFVNVTGAYDTLLPDRTDAQTQKLRELGLRNVERTVEVPTPHSIPMQLNLLQQQSFAQAFDMAFRGN